MTEASSNDEPLPRLYASRQLFGFTLVEQLPDRHAGEAILREAYRQRENVLTEVARRLPDHPIDPRAVLLEISVQYLAD